MRDRSPSDSVATGSAAGRSLPRFRRSQSTSWRKACPDIVRRKKLLSSEETPEHLERRAAQSFLSAFYDLSKIKK